jgi:Fe-S cluster assembly scaffold protein SufB
MEMHAIMPKLESIFNIFRAIGEDPMTALGPGTAHAVAYGHELVSLQSVPGVEIEAKAENDAIRARIKIASGECPLQPIHLCFSMFEQFGVQNVKLDLELEAGASITLWSHCLFTAPIKARHSMEANIRIGEGATLRYHEIHYHGPSGGIEVIPRAQVTLDRKSRFLADFSLIQGRVGMLDIDYTVTVGEEAVAELTSKVYGFGTDSIRIREKLHLNGAGARGLIKSRLAVRDDATAEVSGATYGNAAGARGHVDCMEIVRDRAVASAIPEVKVTNPLAKVTHEAAIGSVDSRQLETLMARGIEPDAAVDIIVRGMLG